MTERLSVKMSELSASDELDANFKYSFDKETGIGVMLKTKCPVLVKRNCNSSHYHCLHVHHQNHMPAKFFDHVMNNLVCEMPEKRLKDYVKAWRVDGRQPIMSFDIPLPENSRITQRIGIKYFHPDCRYILKQIIQYVYDMHCQKRVLKPFGLDDLWIDGGVVKFLGVPFEEEYKPQNKTRNMRDVYQIAKELFGFSEANQIDIDDLLMKLKTKKFYDISEEAALLCHFAIISPQEAVNFMANVGEVSPVKQREDHRCNAIDGIKNCWGWNDKFKDQRLGFINQCWASPFSTYTYYRNDVKDQSGKIICADDGRNVKRSVMRCCRNLVVHLKDHLPAGYRLNLYVHMMVLYLFRKQLYEIHELLNSLHGPIEGWFD